jgi:hypothetical protein
LLNHDRFLRWDDSAPKPAPQFPARKTQSMKSPSRLPVPRFRRKEFMDYLVVLATMTMIVLYAVIVARSLPKT